MRILLPALIAGVVGAPTAVAAPQLPDFDLMAHQGGPGQATTGESLQAFADALEIGVSTIELDIGITKDHEPVVWHDQTIAPQKCTDYPQTLRSVMADLGL